MEPRNEPYTTNAQRGQALLLVFETKVQCFSQYRVGVTPLEESTGGVRTLQHIQLVSKDGGAPLRIGELDAKEQRALLRTHGCAIAVSAQRHGAEAEIDAKEYATFLETATKLLEGLEFTVTMEALPPKTLARSLPPPQRAPSVVVVSGALVILVLLATVAWMALR